MVLNFIKVALRTIWKNKSFSIIAISGLVVGMAAFAMIMQYVLFERSYDKFQDESANIYRVAFTVSDKDKEPLGYATTFLHVAQIMKDEYPEVADYNRILYLDRHAVVTYEDKIFQQENVIYSDPSFFTFFDFPLLKGDARTVLRETNTVVISESLARKYFGDTNPIGKFVKLNEEFNELTLLVTGIHRDIPSNTHLKPKMVVSLRSIESLPETVANIWSWPIYLNYIKLQKGADPLSLESKFPKFADQYIQRNSQQSAYTFFLQPLSSIHLYSHLEYEIEENGNPTMVYLLLFAAILILFIAYVNYINLTTARSLLRAKEVGVRKVLGSAQGQMISQFLIEAGLLNLFALFISAGLVFAGQRYFKEFTGIDFDFTLINTSWFWVGIACSLIVGTILSAFYPAWLMVSFSPIKALKGQSKSYGGSFTRKALVVFQFTATIALMINAYAVYLQVGLMREKSSGININPIVIVNAPRVTENSMRKDSTEHEDPFKTGSLTIRGIQHVSLSASIPGVWISKARGIYQKNHEQEKNLTYNTLGIDDDFMDVYAMQLLAGRNFSDEFPSDKDAIMLTEKAMTQLGFASAEVALHEPIVVDGKERKVIGVVRDYHHFSLRENYQAIIFYPESEHKEFYSIKLDENSMQDVKSVLLQLEEHWKRVYPSNPFEYSFLSNSFQSQYNADIKFGKVFNLFTMMAILLACLGLFGLVSFMTFTRTREIGIRKVLGSTTTEVVLLLLRDLALLLLAAGLISIPIAYFTMADWLNQFAFKIDLTWWVFAIPLLAIATIALITISYQVIKAAVTNPVKSLTCE